MKLAALVLAGGMLASGSIASADDGRMRERCAGGLFMTAGTMGAIAGAYIAADDGWSVGSAVTLGLGAVFVGTGLGMHIHTRGDVDPREHFVRRRCRARIAMGLGVPILSAAILFAIQTAQSQGLEALPWAFATVLSGLVGLVLTLAGSIVRLRTDEPAEVIVSPLALHF